MAKKDPVAVPTGRDVTAFVESVESEVRREDAHTLIELMSEVTGEPPAMWGPTIIGFGSFHYQYDSGREGDSGLIGFSPRKAQTVVYFFDGFDAYGDLLAELGPHSIGKSCLYLKRLDKVDLAVLRTMIERSVKTVLSWQ